MTVVGTKAQMVRFSFPVLFEPKASELSPDQKKFSVQILIPKSSTAVVETVRAAIKQAIAYGIRKGKFNEAATKNPEFKMCLRDGDQAAEEDSEGKKDYLKGHWFFNASSGEQNPPAVVDRFCKPIINRDDFYPGCWGFADVTFGAFQHGKKGVAAWLNSVMKKEDGERLDGRVAPEDAYADLADKEAETGAEREDDALV